MGLGPGETSNLKDRLRHVSASARARRLRYRTIEEARPFPDFLAALDELTGGDDVSRMIHRQLAQPTRVQKRNILVLQAGEPVLATTLRRRAHFWEPATTTCAPFLRLPHREGHLEEALSASLHEVVIPEHIGDPADFRRHEVTPFEVYAMPLQAADFRAYWSENTWRNIVKTRNKTGDLTVAMDDPDALEWLVARWETNWVDHESDEIGAADDLRAVWPELLARGHLKTITLVAGGSPVAAYAMAVRGKTVKGLVTARDKSWTRGSLGIRVLIETMEAARAAGFERLDMGGYSTYKHRFAPSGGIHHTVHLRPMLPGRLDAAARYLRRLGDRHQGATGGRPTAQVAAFADQVML